MTGGTSERASLELGVVGNSALAALVDPRGSVVWMCIPRFDGDPVFCSLLAGSGASETGHWSVVLPNLRQTRQSYWRNTPILETVLTDAAGNGVKITDFAPRFRKDGRIFRPMALVRILEPIAGAPRVSIQLRLRHQYGSQPAVPSRGSNHLSYRLGAEVLRLTTDVPISMVEQETPFLLDRPVAFVLGPDESLSQAPISLASEFLRETHAHWTEWVRYLSVPFEWQELVIRAAITLKLCSYEETGGIVAALTTSIPEFPGSARTWDYRFCWLRDAYFTVRALNRLGATLTMEGYLGYVANVAASSMDGHLQPLYGLGFEARLDESVVPSLAGYRDCSPVRRGNAAFSQVQNDGYGSVILAVAQAFFDERLSMRGEAALFKRLEALGYQAWNLWNRPDAGLWEFRGRKQVHTYSAVMCWAAVDRLARIAAHLGLMERAAGWAHAARTIHEGILTQAWCSDRGHFGAVFGQADIDASLLLMADTGFLHPSDPRFRSTLSAVERELRVGNHVFRYRRADDFGEPEAAFTACTFWLIEAFARVGRAAEAREMFGELIAHRTQLGLLSEGLHVATKTLWGNFPQTYSMVGLINAALSLSKRWEDAF